MVPAEFVLILSIPSSTSRFAFRRFSLNVIPALRNNSKFGIASKIQCFNIGNEHDSDLDVIPVFHLDGRTEDLTE